VIFRKVKIAKKRRVKMDEHIAALAFIMALAAWSIVTDDPQGPVKEPSEVVQHGP